MPSQVPDYPHCGSVLPKIVGINPRPIHKGLMEFPWEPWTERGAGHFKRGPFIHEGKEYVGWVPCCADCLRIWPMTFMLKPSLWLHIASKGDSLCFPCADKRVVTLRGWHIDETDLTAAECNIEWKYLLTRNANG